MNKQEHEETDLDEIDLSNLKLYKSQSKSQKEAIRKIFFACLKELPRELVIQALKEKKIIQQDWGQNGVVIERNKLQEALK